MALAAPPLRKVREMVQEAEDLCRAEQCDLLTLPVDERRRLLAAEAIALLRERGVWPVSGSSAHP